MVGSPTEGSKSFLLGSHLWKVSVEGTGQDASGDFPWSVLTRNSCPASSPGEPWEILTGCFASRVDSIPVILVCLVKWNLWPAVRFACYLDTQAPSQVCFRLAV